MKIVFRADANSKIASGHVMRCLTIAFELIKLGAEVWFVTADHNADPFLENAGVKQAVLGTEYEKKKDEIPVFAEWIRKNNPDGVFIDAYNADREYFDAVEKLCPTMTFATPYDSGFDGDLIVNYSQVHRTAEYTKRFPQAEADGYLLQGLKYAPVREQFRSIPFSPRNELKKVLIMTGGSDPDGMAVAVSEELLLRPELSKITFSVVAGIYSKWYETLKKLEDDHPDRFRVLAGVKDMAGCMAQHDLLVSAGGTTLFEACVSGLPTLSFVMADNQLIMAGNMEKAGLTDYCGDERNGKKEVLGKIADKTAEYLLSPELLRERSIYMHSEIDGKGALMVAEAIVRLVNDK